MVNTRGHDITNKSAAASMQHFFFIIIVVVVFLHHLYRRSLRLSIPARCCCLVQIYFFLSLTPLFKDLSLLLLSLFGAALRAAAAACHLDATKLTERPA
jgi:hypothetical protein